MAKFDTGVVGGDPGVISMLPYKNQKNRRKSEALKGGEALSVYRFKNVPKSIL